MLTSALLIAALAQTPQHRLFMQPNLPRTTLAYFEFAPASGAGMGTACACTTPTGAKGETMTFTRTGDATCSKQGLATTGIANGDLVVCTANQPRVESSGGVLGLRVEGARTNSTLRSQELDNAAWVNNVSSAPFNTTVTANAATAPDGTATADRLDVIATTGTDFSSRAQVAGCPITAQGISVYVRGVSGSGTIDLCNNSTCTSCAYVDTSWSRCVGTAAVVGLGQYALGNFTVATGVSRPTQSVYVWGMDCEAGAYATSYIPTVAAAATRNAELPNFPALAGIYTAGSSALTFNPLGRNTNVLLATAAGDGLLIYTNISVDRNRVFDGINEVSNVYVMAAGVSTRLASSWTGATLTAINTTAGTSTAGAFDGNIGTATSLYVGHNAGSNVAFGLISQVCVDPDPSRCR